MSDTWELWTEYELDVLSNNRDLSISELCRLLPNRTYDAIVERRWMLGISKPGYRYLDIEDNLIVDCRKEGYTYKYITNLLNTLVCNKKRGCVRTQSGCRCRYERYLKTT